MSHHIPEPVGELRLETLESAVFPVRPDSDHHAVLKHSGEKEIEILRSSLQICVHVAHILGERVVEPGLDGCAETRILHETDVEEIFVTRAYFLDFQQTVIPGAIIDKEDASLVQTLGQEVRKGLFKIRHIVLLIEDGNHYGELILTCSVHCNAASA